MATTIEEILLRVRTDLSRSQADLLALAKQLDQLEGKTSTAKAEVNTSEAANEVASLVAELEALDSTDVEAKASIDTSQANSDLAQFVAAVEAASNAEVKAKADLDTSEFLKQAGYVDGVLHGLDDETATPGVKLSTSELAEEVAEVHAVLNDLDRIQADVNVRLDGDRAIADAIALRAEVDSIVHGINVEPEMDVGDVAQVIAEAEILHAELEKILTADVKVKGGFGGKLFGGLLDSADEAAKSISKVQSSAGSAGSSLNSVGVSVGSLSFRLGTAGALVAALAAVIAGTLVTALAALAASLAAAAIGVGALATAFVAALGPAALFAVAVFQRLAQVIAAKKAQDAAADAATKDSAKSTRDAANAEEQRRSASNAVRDARQQLTTAERSYKEAVEQAKDAILDASKAEVKSQKDVSEAERELGKASRDVADARTQAKKDILDAIEEESDAEKDLVRARRQAANDISDAITRVARAEQSLVRTRQDGDKSIEQAARAVQNANDRVADELISANKAIAKSFKDVRDAQFDVRDAQLGILDAEDRVSDLQKQITDLLESAGDANPLESLSKLGNVDLTNFNVSDFAPGLGADEDKAEKLSDLLRELEHAKLSQEKATDQLADSEDKLSDAQQVNSNYVKYGTDAYKPYTDAVRAASEAQSALAQTHETVDRQIADAAEAVASANQTVADTQETVNNRVSEAEEKYGTARQALSDLQGQGVNGSPSVIAAVEQERDARLRVNEAIDAEKETQEKLDDLRAKGVTKAPAVISAAESLRDAHEGLNDALFRQAHLQSSLAGSGDELSAAQQKANLETGKLTKAEKDLLSAVKDIAGVFRDVTKAGVDVFFGDVADAIKIITPALKDLKPTFTDLGKALGNIAMLWATELAKPENIEFFKEAAEAGELLFGILAGPIAIEAFRLFRDVAKVTFPLLIDVVSKATGAFGKFIDSTEEGGDLADFLELGVDSLKSWVHLIGAVSKVFGAFIKDVAPSGDGLVDWLAGAAEGFAKFLNSARGSKTVKDFFTDVLPLAKEMAVFLLRLGTLFFQALGFIAPILAPILKVVNEVVGAFEKLAQGLLTLTRPLRQIGVLFLTAFSDGLGAVLDFVTDGAIDIGYAVVDGVVDGLEFLGKGFVTAISSAWDALLGWLGIKSPSTKGVEVGKNIVAGIIDGIKALPANLAEAAGWVWGKIKTGVSSLSGDILDLGKWITNRIAEGFKTVTNLLSEVGGWLKNRVVEIIQREADGLKTVGSWVINRIADGIQVVTNALGAVGGWVKNRISDLFNAEVEGFKSLGSWVINRIADGLQTVTDSLGKFAGWLKNRISDGLIAIVDDVKGLGEWILTTIISGAVNAPKKIFDGLKNFVDKIVEAVKGFLGIKSPSRVFMEIGEYMAEGLVKGFGAGDVVGFVEKNLGGFAGMAPALIKAGLIDITELPGKAWNQLKELGIDVGGLFGSIFGSRGHESAEKYDDLGDPPDPWVMTAFRAAIAELRADDIEGLSLFEAGIVESGLKNLRFGDADSLGSLQQRASWGSEEERLNPYTSALKFLRAAMALRPHRGTAGQLAQAVQRSKFPDRYDLVAGEAQKALNGNIKSLTEAISAPGSNEPGMQSGYPELANSLIRYAANVANKTFGLTTTSTTGGNHAPNSNHYGGHAIDESNVSGAHPPMSVKMVAYFDWVLKTFGNAIKELFYSWKGFSIKNGLKVANIAEADHWNHVHVALASGGLARGPAKAWVGEGRYEEAVLPLSLDVFRKLAAGIVEQFNLSANPMFNMQSAVVAGQSSSYKGPHTVIETMSLTLPASQPDQTGFDGRHGAAVLMRELQSRGVAA